MSSAIGDSPPAPDRESTVAADRCYLVGCTAVIAGVCVAVAWMARSLRPAIEPPKSDQARKNIEARQ